MTLRTEKQDSILVVTLDRPERRNAVDAATAAALASAFREFDRDPSLSVGILTGAGGHFCGGADLKAIAEGELRAVGPEGDGPMGPTRMRLTKPVIAAIEGYAVAGGLELALWCDLRVASEEAILGVFCRRFGVPLVDLGTVRLPQIVGLGRAMDLILTGRPVKAQEAWTMGLVNRVAPEGQALRAALELARELAALPQTCMRNDRLSMLESLELDSRGSMENEARRGQETLASGETSAGAARFRGGEGRHGR
ncbi:MAG: crotonase/enoyl-CoA hydratase family protein [Myxococcaceae bacterium]|nr:MAG: crotonase/enoyl-CoA hydratase family protein [Myxococcaceae bacterium]